MRKISKKLIAIAMATVMSCTVLTTTASAAWVKNDKGTAWQNADGTYAKSKWMTMKNGNKYYIKADGTRATGLLSMKNKQGGKDYYFFNDSGIMQTGWQSVKGDVYYFKADGIAATGMQVIGNYTYKFSSDGKWDSKVYSKDGKKDVTSTVKVNELVPVASTDRSAEYGKVKKITGEKPATITINGLTYRTDADNSIAGSKQIYVFPQGNYYTKSNINIANCTDADVECLKYLNDIEILSLVTCSEDLMTAKTDKEHSIQITTQGAYVTPSKITNLDFCYYMPNLKYVEINNAPYLTDISGLSACKNLKEVTIRNSGVKNLDGLENLTKIDRFYALNTRLENLNGLVNCKNLRTVFVENSYLNDISALANKERLKTLTLDTSRRLKDISVIETCKNITEVYLDGCNSVMDWSSLERLTNLKSYRIRYASKSSNAAQVRDTLKNRGIQWGIYDALDYDVMKDAPHKSIVSAGCSIYYWDKEMLNYKDIYATNYPCTCNFCKTQLQAIGNWTGVKGANAAMVALGTYQE